MNKLIGNGDMFQIGLKMLTHQKFATIITKLVQYINLIFQTIKQLKSGFTIPYPHLAMHFFQYESEKSLQML